MNNYLPDETMLIEILYILYNEHGRIPECNDGRISKMYFERKEG